MFWKYDRHRLSFRVISPELHPARLNQYITRNALADTVGTER
nr:MAG TPA: hypothetical protein [Caudoviricetes sp.]